MRRGYICMQTSQQANFPKNFAHNLVSKLNLKHFTRSVMNIPHSYIFLLQLTICTFFKHLQIKN